MHFEMVYLWNVIFETGDESSLQSSFVVLVALCSLRFTLYSFKSDILTVISEPHTHPPQILGGFVRQ